MAHEINNPLAGIQNAFLLIKDAVPASHPHHGYVAAVQRELDRLAMITRRIAETGRSDAGASIGVSAAAVIARALRTIDESRRGKHVPIESDTRDAPERLAISEDLLWQVVYHLTQNAVEDSPPGEIVRVRAWSERGTFLLSVRGKESGRSRTRNLGLMLARRYGEAIGGTLELLHPAEGEMEVRFCVEPSPSPAVLA